MNGSHRDHRLHTTSGSYCWRALGIGLGIWSIPILAVAANPIESAVLRCSVLADSELRLQCFDAVSASLSASAHYADPQLPKEAARADDREIEPSASGHERFGEETLPESSASRAEAIRGISAEIVGISRAPRGEVVFELSNGQTWVQISPRRYDYRIGMPVTIERSALGSYTLATDQGGATRVRRIR
jgi:hypothetical protein